MSDGLIRVCRSDLSKIPKNKRDLFKNDSSERNFWLTEEWLEDTEYPEEIEEQGQSGGEEDFEEYGIVEIHEVFSRYHISSSTIYRTRKTK